MADESRTPIFDEGKKYVGGVYQQLRNVKSWNKTETDTEGVELLRVHNKVSTGDVNGSFFKSLIREWPAFDVDLSDPENISSADEYYGISFSPAYSPWGAGFEFRVSGGVYMDGQLVTPYPTSSGGTTEYYDVSTNTPVNHILHGASTAIVEDSPGVTYTITDDNRNFRTAFDLTNGCTLRMTSGGAVGAVGTISTRTSSTELVVSGNLSGASTGDTYVILPPPLPALSGTKDIYLLCWYEQVDESVDSVIEDPTDNQVPCWRVQDRWCLYSGYSSTALSGEGNSRFAAVKLFTIQSDASNSLASHEVDPAKPWENGVLTLEASTKLLTNSARRDFYRSPERSSKMPVVVDASTSSKVVFLEEDTAIVYNHEVDASPASDLSVALVTSQPVDNAVSAVTGQAVIKTDESSKPALLAVESILEGQGYDPGSDSNSVMSVRYSGAEFIEEVFVHSEPLLVKGLNWRITDEFSISSNYIVRVTPGTISYQGGVYHHVGETTLDINTPASWDTGSVPAGLIGVPKFGYIYVQVSPSSKGISSIKLSSAEPMWSGDGKYASGGLSGSNICIGTFVYVYSGSDIYSYTQYCVDRKVSFYSPTADEIGLEVLSVTGSTVSTPFSQSLSPIVANMDLAVTHTNAVETFGSKSIGMFFSPFSRGNLYAVEGGILTETRLTMPYLNGKVTLSTVGAEANSVFKVYVTGYTLQEGFIQKDELWSI